MHSSSGAKISNSASGMWVNQRWQPSASYCPGSLLGAFLVPESFLLSFFLIFVAWVLSPLFGSSVCANDLPRLLPTPAHTGSCRCILDNGDLVIRHKGIMK